MAADKKPKKPKRAPGKCAHNEKCIHEFKDGTTLPDSNELLNIFLIILGIFYLMQGILMYFPWLLYINGNVGNVLGSVFLSEGGLAFANTLSGNYIVIGGGALMAGIGMFAEQEWGWGMALIILLIVIFSSIFSVLAFNWASWIWWVQVLSLVFAIIGIPWLLATKERYY